MPIHILWFWEKTGKPRSNTGTISDQTVDPAAVKALNPTALAIQSHYAKTALLYMGKVQKVYSYGYHPSNTESVLPFCFITQRLLSDFYGQLKYFFTTHF